jgi:hypothetical protein
MTPVQAVPRCRKFAQPEGDGAPNASVAGAPSRQLGSFAYAFLPHDPSRSSTVATEDGFPASVPLAGRLPSVAPHRERRARGTCPGRWAFGGQGSVSVVEVEEVVVDPSSVGAFHDGADVSQLPCHREHVPVTETVELAC